MVQKNHNTKNLSNEYGLSVERMTAKRIKKIKKDNEDFDDALTRLLDNAIEEIPIETIFTDLLEQFEDAVSISVTEATCKGETRPLTITVYTGNVPVEEHVTLYQNQESRAVVESNNGARYSLQYRISVTPTGPHREMLRTTPVYMTENVLGADPISLEQGIEKLRSKIDMTVTERRESLDLQ